MAKIGLIGAAWLIVLRSEDFLKWLKSETNKFSFEVKIIHRCFEKYSSRWLSDCNRAKLPS